MYVMIAGRWSSTRPEVADDDYDNINGLEDDGDSGRPGAVLRAIRCIDLSASPNEEPYWWLEVIDVHRRVYQSVHRHMPQGS
jgi:hypothetical protein